MKRQVKKTVQKGLCMLLAGVAVLTASLSLTACVDQHPDSTEGQSQADSVRLVATSPAAAQICDKLELDLVGVCRTSGTLPERYKDVTQVGTAMSPDMEILKSLSPDYVLSPNSLQSDLQPKYASIQVKSLFFKEKVYPACMLQLQTSVKNLTGSSRHRQWWTNLTHLCRNTKIKMQEKKPRRF